ncbi:uncharacterized protein K489DRAFT_340533, partial [Dissoconium aciculare CBS 342.82]|uniref:Peroxisomal biogenesis factor 11 n=1 Tax=Dissoconium aciculare CBS 342.82 TaxID=1314786 RepID=A0A6J3M3F0_9PEZI
MLAAAVRITEDLPGLEKTLRLFQGLSTIAVGLAQTAEEQAIRARAVSQFAVSRRFFRLLKWYPCWSKASAAWSARQVTIGEDGKTRDPMDANLDFWKWSILGMYFFVEMFTITNAMGVTDYPVLKTVQNEANKLWFYGLVASIILSLYQLFLSSTGNDTAAANEKTSNPRSNTPFTTSNKASALWEAIVIDACDLFLPGSSLGWLPVSTLVVGIAGTTSTTVAGKQIWLRLRREQ